jgi:hypothetical protein
MGRARSGIACVRGKYIEYDYAKVQSSNQGKCRACPHAGKTASFGNILFGLFGQVRSVKEMINIEVPT